MSSIEGIGIIIDRGVTLSARIKDGESWSPILTITLKVDEREENLKVTEVNYNPASGGVEFIEFKNTGSAILDLSQYSFTNGIDYTFDSCILQANDFVVLTSDTSLFKSIYGFNALGQYEGVLSNSGEKLVLLNDNGSTALSFTYEDEFPWPIGADGYGLSLVQNLQSVDNDFDSLYYWRGSTNTNGSPYSDDPESTIGKVTINEVLSNPAIGGVDKIELFNPQNTAIDIGNWYLTDDIKDLRKWQIPNGTQIGAQEYWTIDESSFGSAFSISSSGESIYLSSVDTGGNMTSYTTGVSFMAAEEDVSFGSYTNSVGDSYFIPQEEQTFGLENTLHKKSDANITAINYHPIDGEFEYIEIYNSSEKSIDLYDANNSSHTWKIKGVDFNFPERVSLDAKERIYVIEQDITANEFKSTYNLPTSTKAYNMMGKISNSGETLSLLKTAPSSNENLVSDRNYIMLESVTYDDKLPWKKEADGEGYALARINVKDFSNDPASWTVKLGKEMSITQSIDNNISIYPNPSEGIINVDFDKWTKETKLEVRDLSGRLLMLKTVESEQEKINLTGYTNGIYFIHIHSADINISRKVVKK